MAAHEALTIRCGRCGGTFGFLPYPGNARCPYCAFEQPVSAELIFELRRYAGNVGHELARADDAYQRAANWQQWVGHDEHNVPRLKLVLSLASVLMLLAIGAIPVSLEFGISNQAVGAVLTPVIVLLALFVPVYAIYASTSSAARAKRAAAGSISVACPNCGAMGALVAGAAAQICNYCRSALVASAPVMQAGVDAAELAHRRARLEEFRQARLGMAGLMAYDVSAYLPYMVFGSILLPAGGGAVSFTLEMLAGDEPYHPSIWGLWAITLVLLAGLILTPLRRHSRNARYRAALADLAQQFPLTPIRDANGLAHWLNRHWPAEYDVAALASGPYFCAGGIHAYGYPLLLNADLGGFKNRKPRLHLLLAAHRPHAHASYAASPHVQHALERCRSLGFEVSMSEAGLLAIASEQTLRIVRKSPAALHELAPVLAALAAVAWASGAVPVEHAA